MKNAKQKLEQGFTLIEMLVIAPIVVLAIGAFLTVIISMTGEVISSRGANALTYDVQDAISRIEQDVKLSTTFLATNNITLDPAEQQGYNNDGTNFTNVAGTSGTSLILNMLVTTGNPLTTGSGIVYLENQPNACASTQVADNTPMTMNVVYFVKNDPANNNIPTLWRRTIMPSNYATSGVACATPWQQPSCFPGYTSSFCKTNDIKLVAGVTPENFVVQYYTAASATVPNTTASDPLITDDTVRATALQSAPTVAVSILAQQNVAGRTVDRAATLRATRLETNASSIASLVAATTPAAPVISSTSLSAPTNVTFNWNNVAGATGYTLRYRINGGSWTSPVTQSGNSFTVTDATYQNTVELEVAATNSAGTSANATSSVTVPLWTPMTLQNTWTTYAPSFSSPAYTKTSAGLVVLKGMIKGGSGVIANLPVGFRPATNEALIVETSSNQAYGRLDINVNGDISMSVGNNAWFSMDGISFAPSSSLSFTPFSSLLNGWSNYSPANGGGFAQASYATDSNGRVHTRGLIRGGTTTNGTSMAVLPAGSRPDGYAHVFNVNSNVHGTVGYDTSGNVLAKGGGNSYTSLNWIFYPAGRTTGTSCTTQWCNLSLSGTWVQYSGAFSSPQYTKSADGLVVLKGLIRSGATSGTILTLPAGYCPRETLLLTVSTADVWGRVDVTSGAAGSGCTITASSVNAAWLSLDGIRFIGEV